MRTSLHYIVMTSPLKILLSVGLPLSIALSGCKTEVKASGMVSKKLSATSVEVTITTPVDNSYVTSSNQKSFEVSGTCSQNEITLSLKASTTTSASISSNVVCTNNVWSAHMDLSTLNDGKGTISVNDVLGSSLKLSSTASVKIIKDTSSAASSSSLTPGNSGVLTVSNVLDTTATLSWTIASDSTTSASNLQYLVYWSTSSSMNTVATIKANGTAVGTYASNISTLNVTGLIPSKTLYFNVLVKNQAGVEAAYSQVSATTINYLWIGGYEATLLWNSIGTSGFSVANYGAGALNGPSKVVSDTNYLYVSDPSNYRVVRYVRATGAYAGWIGTIGTLPLNDANCPNPVVGSITPGWCMGGAADINYSTSKGMNAPFGLVIDNGGNLYVADYGLNIVLKFIASTGAWVGWIGAKNNTATTTCTTDAHDFTSGGWCNTDTSVALGFLAFGGLFRPYGIATDNTYIYVTQVIDGRISRYNMDGTFAGWIGWINNTQAPSNSGSCPLND